MSSSLLPIKDQFDLPADTVYLNGNSLGPLPKAVPERVNTMLNDQWGAHLITGWNVDDWMGQPARVGNMIAPLIGAPADTVMIGDTLSIKVHQALAAGLALRPKRKIILSDSGNFPTDLYMAEGLIKALQQGHELRIVAPEEVFSNINEEVAVVMLTHVDYRSGRLHDMMTISKQAQLHGAVMLWDLAHSAGAVDLELAKSECEMAIGCTYKYFNGGPGAPAFIYVREDLIEQIDPILSGWLGHDAPFQFELNYRPSPNIERFRVGTPPVIQTTALETALSVWQGIDMQSIRAASIRLSERFIKEVEQRCPQLTLASPRAPKLRGSQVSFAFEHGYATMQALIANKIIGDFRSPDIMRFGFTPLYIDEADVLHAVDVLARLLDEKAWENPQYQVRNRVT